MAHRDGMAPEGLGTGQTELRRKTHETIKRVTDSMGRRYAFNTAVASNMELVNAIADFEDPSPTGRKVCQEALEAVVRMLAPILPHVCHVLWHRLGHEEPVYRTAWPGLDSGALKREVVEMVVQVNGKKRGTVSVPAGMDNNGIEQAARDNENVLRFIENREITKVVVCTGSHRKYCCKLAAMRHYLGLLLPLLIVSGMLPGCGFRLAGSGGDADQGIESISLQGPGSSRVLMQFTRNFLESNKIRVVGDEQASARLEILFESAEKEVLSLDSDGKAREYDLVLSIAF